MAEPRIGDNYLYVDRGSQIDGTPEQDEEV
jgi:hypothetical protein